MAGDNSGHNSYCRADHVDAEVHANPGRRLFHIRPQDVTLNLSHRAGRLFNGRSVIALQGFEAAQARQHDFRPPAESGRRVGQDRSQGYLKARLCKPPVYRDGCSAPGGAVFHKAVVGGVVEDGHPAHHLGPKFFQQIVPLEGTVSPGGDHHRDVLGADARLLDGIQNPG